MYHAIFGDYYRAINNPGVGIIYGGLFSIFGAYGTVAIPWTVIYSAFASLLIGLIGFSQRLPVKLCRTAMLLVFFMPGFFIFPPIYRDNFIVFLLVLSAYTAILAPRGNIVLHSAAISLESILLFSLRTAYLPIPFIFGGVAVYMYSVSSTGVTGRRMVFAGITLLAIVVAWAFLSQYLELSFDRLGAASESSDREFSTLMAFKQLGPLIYYPAAAIFTLLAPMPWWQSVTPSLLSYQIFSYAQTWYGLTALIALYYSYRRNWLQPGASILVIFFLIVFLLVLLGSLNFSALYFQIALPFVLLASVRYLSTNWGKCFLMSTSIIALVHALLWGR